MVKEKLQGFHLFVTMKKVELVLLVLIAIYALTMIYLSLVKYYTFQAFSWDLGVFSQSFYTTLNFRRFFYNNLELGSHFHVHFSPILTLLLPFYAVYQSPVTLLIVQSIFLALGAYPLYVISKKELNSKVFGLTFSALYLLYPLLFASNLCDFHPEFFIPLLGFSAIYFFKNNRWGRYFLFILLLLMVKEDVCLVVIGIGLYGFFKNVGFLVKRKRVNKTMVVSLITILVGVCALFLAFYVISCFVDLDGYGALWDHGYTHHTENTYSEIGGSEGIIGILSYMVSNPLKVVNHLVCYMPMNKLVFLSVLFLPLCMFSFLDIPSIFLFFPALMELMLASNPNYFGILSYYPLRLIPMIFIAALHSIKKFSVKFDEFSVRKWVVSRLLIIMLISTLIVLLFTTPILLKDFNLTISETDEAKHQLISLIPIDSNLHILTQSDYFPHVSNSLYSYAYWNTTPVNYILIDVSSVWFYRYLIPDEYVAKYGEPQMQFNEIVRGYIKNGSFGLVAQAGGLLLYEKGYEGKLHFFAPYTTTINWKKLNFYGNLVYDSSSISQYVILHKASSQRKEPYFWYGPYIWLPPGKYEATFRLKISNFTDKYIITLDVAKNLGREILVSSILTGKNFSQPNTWQEFSLSFTLEELTPLVEFRGINVSNATDVYLDCIMVRQISSFSDIAES